MSMTPNCNLHLKLQPKREINTCLIFTPSHFHRHVKYLKQHKLRIIESLGKFFLNLYQGNTCVFKEPFITSTFFLLGIFHRFLGSQTLKRQGTKPSDEMTRSETAAVGRGGTLNDWFNLQPPKASSQEVRPY